MAIRRLPGPPRSVPLPTRNQTVYEIDLSAAPSPAWRAAFLWPPPALTTARFTPELGRVGLHGAAVLFRTTPSRMPAWLKWIDRWIEYANSIVAEPRGGPLDTGAFSVREHDT